MLQRLLPGAEAPQAAFGYFHLQVSEVGLVRSSGNEPTGDPWGAAQPQPSPAQPSSESARQPCARRPPALLDRSRPRGASTWDAKAALETSRGAQGGDLWNTAVRL